MPLNLESKGLAAKDGRLLIWVFFPCDFVVIFDIEDSDAEKHPQKKYIIRLNSPFIASISKWTITWKRKEIRFLGKCVISGKFWINLNPGKWTFWTLILEVDGRWCSFSIGWFLGEPAVNFQGKPHPKKTKCAYEPPAGFNQTKITLPETNMFTPEKKHKIALRKWIIWNQPLIFTSFRGRVSTSSPKWRPHGRCRSSFASISLGKEKSELEFHWDDFLGIFS